MKTVKYIWLYKLRFDGYTKEKFKIIRDTNRMFEVESIDGFIYTKRVFKTECYADSERKIGIQLNDYIWVEVEKEERFLNDLKDIYYNLMNKLMEVIQNIGEERLYVILNEEHDKLIHIDTDCEYIKDDDKE